MLDKLQELKEAGANVTAQVNVRPQALLMSW